jgi:tetratricopeptide (TPR) repeat protein
VSAPRLPPEAQVLPQLQAVVHQLQAGRFAEARALVEPVLRIAPRSPDAWHLYAVALFKLGDAPAAESAARQALTLDKRQAPFQTTLGDILAAMGATDKAEAAYRAALALNRRFVPAVRQLAQLLTRAGRADDALKAIAPLAAAGPLADAGLLNAHADALKAAGRSEEALAAYQAAVAASPQSGVAEHNVAAVLGDLGRSVEAEEAARRAFSKGLEAPETRLVHGRALAQIGRFDEAEDAFRAALAQRPSYPDAHRDLAQLVWMRTEDVGQAVAWLDRAIRQDPAAIALRQLKAKVLTFAGDAIGADAVLAEALRLAPDDAVLQMSAAQGAIEAGDPLRGLAHAERARALAPGDPQAETFICEALLAAGRADEAAAAAEEIVRRSPMALQALAYLATARRLTGDGRYLELYDYDAFVKPWTIDTPDGWPSLESFLSDLAETLYGRHRLKTHPLDQSLRQGSQISQLMASNDPVIRAFFKAVDRPIRAHLAALGSGKDPLRARNAGGYRFQGAWSVRLRAGGGRHVDHIHPEGWLSSACYIDLPKAVSGEGRQGWIKFGAPGTPTLPKLEPEHFVKPEPGRIVLFPSYMWHGTMPFEGDDNRLTIAFDLVPTRR